MKLINADAIEYHMMAKEDWLGNTTEDSKMVWKADIDSMPAVDAIPIDFINNHMIYLQMRMDAYCYPPDPDPFSYELYVLQRLVRMWEVHNKKGKEE